jgi:hypothetical protein
MPRKWLCDDCVECQGCGARQPGPFADRSPPPATKKRKKNEKKKKKKGGKEGGKRGKREKGPRKTMESRSFL